MGQTDSELKKLLGCVSCWDTSPLNVEKQEFKNIILDNFNFRID